MTRAEFKVFTDTIDPLNISLRALAWVQLITDKNRNEFELTLLKYGFVHSYIKKITDQSFQSSPIQSQYLPIAFIESLEANKSAVGIDISTHPFVGDSANKAIKLKKHAITPLLSLLQQQEEEQQQKEQQIQQQQKSQKKIKLRE